MCKHSIEVGYTSSKDNPVCSELCISNLQNETYRKVPKFSDARKLCCNLPLIQTNKPNLRISSQNNENGIANSEDPDQTAPLRVEEQSDLGLNCLLRPICPKT